MMLTESVLEPVAGAKNLCSSLGSRGKEPPDMRRGPGSSTPRPPSPLPALVSWQGDGGPETGRTHRPERT